MTYITEFMSEDHDRLDAIFADFRKETSGEKAKELFVQFESGLRAHIGWEEGILFPPFEERTGMRRSGPTAVMRMEHQQIKHLLESMRVRAGSRDADESARSLVEVLRAHNQKEEDILYPWLDRSLADGEKSALLARIKESPAGV